MPLSTLLIPLMTTLPHTLSSNFPVVCADYQTDATLNPLPEINGNSQVFNMTCVHLYTRLQAFLV